MKKITSKNPISFRVDGDTLLEIGPEGCIASDAAAKIAVERLGEHITVVETSIKEAVGDAKSSLEGPSHAELKAEAEDLGLAKSGSKAELAERIAAHKAAGEGASAPASPAPTAPETPVTPEATAPEAGAPEGAEIGTQKDPE